MATIAVRMLFVGGSSPRTSAILTRLGQKGWGSYGVDALKEAQTLMTTFKFDLVLALENLADGRGYDLAEQVTQGSNSLLVGIALSDTYLWLPVIYHGKKVMGERAINSEMVERELEDILTAADRVHTRETIRGSSEAATRVMSTRVSRVRRREAGPIPAAISPSPSFPDALLQAERTLLRRALLPRPAHSAPDSPDPVRKVS
jgi:hypothetical protein